MSQSGNTPAVTNDCEDKKYGRKLSSSHPMPKSKTTCGMKDRMERNVVSWL